MHPPENPPTEARVALTRQMDDLASYMARLQSGIELLTVMQAHARALFDQAERAAGDPSEGVSLAPRYQQAQLRFLDLQNQKITAFTDLLKELRGVHVRIAVNCRSGFLMLLSRLEAELPFHMQERLRSAIHYLAQGASDDLVRALDRLARDLAEKGHQKHRLAQAVIDILERETQNACAGPAS